VLKGWNRTPKEVTHVRPHHRMPGALRRLRVQTVSYKGTAPAITDLMGGQIDFMCDQTTNTTGQIKAGTLNVYGVTTRKRVPSLPDIPTLQEQGAQGIRDRGLAWPVCAPGHAQSRARQAEAALRTAVQDPAFREALAKLGAEPVSPEEATPESLRKLLKAETDKWGPIIKKAGVYAD